MGSLCLGELVARRLGASRGSGLLGGDASGFSLRRGGFRWEESRGGVREKEILCHNDTFLHRHLPLSLPLFSDRTNMQIYLPFSLKTNECVDACQNKVLSLAQ